jgi:anti-sigma28 factor (negative regulator of flagellin synthesis)
MDIIQKEIQKRESEIIKELELLFKANLKITEWDIPEVDQNAAAKALVEVLEKGIEKIKKDIEDGKY